MCDIIALNILKRGPFYKENKYLFVTDEDAFQVKFLVINNITVKLQKFDLTCEQNHFSKAQTTLFTLSNLTVQYH